MQKRQTPLKRVPEGVQNKIKIETDIIDCNGTVIDSLIPRQLAQHDVFAHEDGEDSEAHRHHGDPGNEVDNGSFAGGRDDGRARHRMMHRSHGGPGVERGRFGVTFTDYSEEWTVCRARSGHMRGETDNEKEMIAVVVCRKAKDRC